MSNTIKELAVDEQKAVATKTDIPSLPEGLRLKLVHLHQGNSSRKQRHGHSYVTHARVVNKEDVVIANGIAMCSNKDNPSRAIGRRIAIGRVVKDLKKCEALRMHFLKLAEEYQSIALAAQPLSLAH